MSRMQKMLFRQYVQANLYTRKFVNHIASLIKIDGFGTMIKKFLQRKRSKDTTSLEYLYPIDPYDAHLNDMSIGSESMYDGLEIDNVYCIGPFYAIDGLDGNVGPFTHAIDFLIQDGTNVRSAQDGVIVEIKQDSNKRGPDYEYQDALNYVIIEHNGGKEYSQYSHIAQGSVAMSGFDVGDSVKKGQTIAVVGKSGCTTRDHLHFVVFRKRKPSGDNPRGIESLQIRFEH